LVILRLVVCAILALVVARTIPGYQWRWPSNWRGIKPLLSFGAWISLSNVVSPTLVYADRFLLGHLRGLAPVGLYSAPFDAVMRSTLISALGRPDISAKFHMLELAIHLPLAWWLVSTYGITGAATAWTVRVIFDSLLLFRAGTRLMRFPDKLREFPPRHAPT